MDQKIKVNKDNLILTMYVLSVFIIQINTALGMILLIATLILSSNAFSIFICISIVLFEPFMPFFFGYSTATFVAVAFVIKNTRFIKPRIENTTFIYIIFMILIVLGFLIAINSSVNTNAKIDLNLTLILKVVLSFILYNIVSYHISKQKLFKIFSIFSPILLIIVFILYSLNSFSGNEASLYQRYIINYSSPGTYSVIISWFIVFATNNLFNAKKIYFKFISLISIILIFICIAKMGTRSGIISFMVAIVFCLFILNRDKKKEALFSIIALAGVIIYFIFSHEVEFTKTILYRFGIENPKIESLQDYSKARYFALVNFFDILTHNDQISFLFGNGVSNKIESTIVYYYTGYYKIIHNVFFSIANQTGVLGLITFLSFIYNGLRGIYKNHKQENIFKIALAVLLVGGIFSPLQNSDFLWMGIGLALVKV